MLIDENEKLIIHRFFIIFVIEELLIWEYEVCGSNRIDVPNVKKLNKCFSSEKKIFLLRILFKVEVF